MEPQQQQQNSTNEEGGCSGKGGFNLSRQSSTRWTPTSDQIRILKELYYNNGIRSPNAEQIQRISARLRQYGKIEGKNVFYWFQNHKARERQKKRFTSDQHLPIQMQRNAASPWKPDQDQSIVHTTKYSNISSTGISSASSSSAGMVAVGQMGNYGYGSVPMEKSFRECSISAGGSSGYVGSAIDNQHNLGWVGMDPYSSAYTTLFEKVRPSTEEILQDEEELEDQNTAPEIETLPLFPMHGDDIHGYCNLKSHDYDNGGWYLHTEDGFINGSRASLELSLNSYTTRRSPDFV